MSYQAPSVSLDSDYEETEFAAQDPIPSQSSKEERSRFDFVASDSSESNSDCGSEAGVVVKGTAAFDSDALASDSDCESYIEEVDVDLFASDCRAAQYIDPNVFDLLNDDQKLRLLSLVESIPLNADIASKKLSEEAVDVLRQSLVDGKRVPCVYTAHLLDDCLEVENESSLTSLRQQNFFNDPRYPSMTPVLKETEGCFHFKLVLDADATSLHTDTLHSVKGCLRIHNTPQFGQYKKVKHLWNGESLSNLATFVLGDLAKEWEWLVLFRGYKQYDKDVGKVFKSFYADVIYEAFKESDQHGRAGLWKDKNDFMQNTTNARQVPLEEQAIARIQEKASRFTYAGQRVQVIFSFQLFGHKQILADTVAIEAFMDKIDTVFRIDEICDSNNEQFARTSFLQDLAFNIIPVCSSLKPQTVFWNANIHQHIANQELSPIKRLLVLNDKSHYTAGSEKNQINKGQTVTYPNMGLGAVQSSMTKFGGSKNLMVECKAYFSGSEDFRHANKSPFHNSCYSVAAVPISSLLDSTSTLVEGKKTKIMSTVSSLVDSFSSKNGSELKKLSSVLKSLHNSTYGCRLEVTCLNTAKAGIISVYEYLERVSQNMVRMHNTLVHMFQRRLIPIESLRFSPLQRVSTPSMAAIVELQAKELYASFNSLFMFSVKDFNITDTIRPSVINALAVLEDLQQLLWSGNLVYLNNPRLMNELGVIENITRFGKIYIPSSLLMIKREAPVKTTCNISSTPKGFEEIHADDGHNAELEEADEEDLAFRSQLLLSKRMFYRAFKGHASVVMELLDSLSPAVEMHMMPASSLITPLWESKTQIIACNLLNAFFDDVLCCIGIPSQQKELFFNKLKQQSIDWPSIAVAKSSMIGSRFIDMVLPVNAAKTPDSLLQSPYFAKWNLVDKTLANLNKVMVWHNFAPPREKEKIVLDDSRPVIRKDDIVKQALIALHQCGVKWVPYITEEQLVAQTVGRNPKFVFMPVQLIHSSVVLTHNTHIMGSPLPHPVDGSFIFLVSCLVGKAIDREIAKHRETFRQTMLQSTVDGSSDILSLDEDFSQYLRTQMSRDRKFVYEEEGEGARKLSYSWKTFVGFVLFHYTRASSLQSKVSPKYSNLSLFFLFYSGLVVKKIGRGLFQLQSLNKVFNIYQNLKD